MLTRSIIERMFNHTIRDKFKNYHGVRDYLLTHPNKYKLIDNLIGELYRVENSVVSTDINAIKQIIKDMVIFFAQTALKVKEQELKTDLQKVLDQRELTAKQELLKDLENQEEASVELFDSNTR